MPEMARIIISTNMTLDGIGQDPTGEEGFKFGGWFDTMTDQDREAWAKIEFEEALGTAALLMGGRSYEWFAARWADRPGEWAERLRRIPKYVVRSGAGRSDWGPTTVLTGDIAAEVAAVKRALEGDLVVYASYQLVHTVLEHELADEVRLFLFPQLLGSGGRVFSDLTSAHALRLTDAGTVGLGLVKVTYQIVHDAT
jgi:dihydrofolate reductase